MAKAKARKTFKTSYRESFTLPNGKRCEVTTHSQAEKYTVSLHINKLIRAINSGAPALDSIDWASKLPNGTIKKSLIRWGLFEPSDTGKTLEDLKNTFLAMDRKSNTIKSYTGAFNNLEKYFGLNKLLSEIKEKDAESFVGFMKSKSNAHTGGALDATSWTRRARLISQFFRWAVKKHWILSNPFDALEFPHVDVDKETWQYIPQEDVLKVINMNSGNPALQLEIALARYAGYRGASEYRRLTWSESILWKEKQILTHSTKTEGMEGHEVRYVPMAPIVEKILKKLWEQTKPGEDRIYPNMKETSNPGVVIKKAFTRAGVSLGQPKNLRKSFVCDLMESGLAGQDQKMFEEICGHSVRMSMHSYQMVHKERREKATETFLNVFTQNSSTDNLDSSKNLPTVLPTDAHSFAHCKLSQGLESDVTEIEKALEIKGNYKKIGEFANNCTAPLYPQQESNLQPTD